MAGKKRLPNGSIQYVVKKAGLLPKPLYFTFANEKEGDAYVARVLAAALVAALRAALNAPLPMSSTAP